MELKEVKFSVENIGECVAQWTPTLINCLSFHPQC